MKTLKTVAVTFLGIQGLAEESVHKTLFGKQVPGSGRTVFLRYSYQAMLGIEGKGVSIEQTGDKAYRVTIPEFIFIGSENHESGPPSRTTASSAGSPPRSTLQN